MQKETTRERSILGWFIPAFLLVLCIKIYLAIVLDLYSDEIFYWWASTRLALAYSDLPFMTALLAGLGSGFEPAGSLQVRSWFLLLGSSIPFLVYWLAKPVSGHRQALESSLLTLCLPLGGFLGLLAVPDVPLIFFGLLAIGSFERALRTDAWRYWLATGLFVALGLSTHYRFFLYPLAAVLFLLLFKAEHRQWRNTRFWCSVALASLGLIPILWFNLSNQLSSASFYLVERHPWEFQPAGLLHLFKQAALVTPPLYLVFLYTLWCLLKQSQAGERQAALLLAFAITNLSVYWLLAPWTDANSTSIHWPLSGYFPLLVAVPAALRSLYQSIQSARSKQYARNIVLAIPAIGFAGTMIAFIGVGSQAFQLQLQTILGTGVLSNKMAGWKEFAAHTEPLLGNYFQTQSRLLLTDNYYTAAQAEFADITDTVFTLDTDKAVRDGRITQIRLWAKDISGLAQFQGQPALFVKEDSSLNIDDKDALMHTVCNLSESVTKVSDLSLFNGDKAFSYYFLDQIQIPDGDSKVEAASPCPFPTHAWIDSPVAGQTLTGQVAVNGWAYNEDIGVAMIELLIDGEAVATIDYGIPRPDVVAVRNVQSDPQAPNLGFDFQFDTTSLENGRYELALHLVNQQGHSTIYGSRDVVIDNQGFSD